MSQTSLIFADKPNVPSAALQSKSIFGAELDALARSRGFWPGGAIVFAVEVFGKPPSNTPPESVQIMLTGAVPVGVQKDGRPKFGKRTDDKQVVISLAEYRAAISLADGRREG